MTPLVSQPIHSAVRPVLPGLFFGVLTLLFGFGLGVVFGLNEALIQDRLLASATAAPPEVYQQDEAKQKAVIDKSWAYMQRAHLHAGSLGAVAVALSLVVVAIGTSAAAARATSLALGVGGLGYAVFWLAAGFRAPGLGSTGAAKESLKWLALPSVGLVVAATAAVGVFVVLAMLKPRSTT